MHTYTSPRTISTHNPHPQPPHTHLPPIHQVRIVTESLASYPTLLYGPHKPPDTTTTTGGVSSGAAAMGAAMDSAIQRLKERHLGGGGVGGGGGILGMDGALGSKVSYAGVCLFGCFVYI